MVGRRKLFPGRWNLDLSPGKCSNVPEKIEAFPEILERCPELMAVGPESGYLVRDLIERVSASMAIGQVASDLGLD